MAKRKEYVRIEEIADIFGVTTRRVQQLTQDGVIETLIRTESGKKVKRYDKDETLRKYIKFLSDKANGREKKTSIVNKEEAKLQAEVDIKQAKAKIIQLNLDELEGRLHAAEDVEAMTTDLVLNVRSALLSMPGQLAVDVAEVTDPAECSEIINKVVIDILDDLSRYQYDPNEYRRRVRERQGWLNGSEEEPDDSDYE